MRDTRTTSRGYRNGHRPDTSSDAFQGLKRALIFTLTLPARFITFITTPPGSAIMLGLGVMYFAGVSVEGYWQAMNPANPAFLPKPFIRDGANLAFLVIAFISPSFWLASIVSLIVQGIQAFVLREIDIERAKAEYEAVASYRVPEPTEGELDIAEHRRKKFKTIGMRTIRTRGALIALTYAIDTAIAFWNFPVIGQSTGELLINLVWILASIFGTEAMINLFFSAVAPVKSHPPVEVIP